MAIILKISFLLNIILFANICMSSPGYNRSDQKGNKSKIKNPCCKYEFSASKRLNRRYKSASVDDITSLTEYTQAKAFEIGKRKSKKINENPINKYKSKSFDCMLSFPRCYSDLNKLPKVMNFECQVNCEDDQGTERLDFDPHSSISYSSITHCDDSDCSKRLDSDKGLEGLEKAEESIEAKFHTLSVSDNVNNNGANQINCDDISSELDNDDEDFLIGGIEF